MDRLIEKITAAVKNPKILIALGLTGILLICLPSFFGGSKKNETVRGGEINVEEYRAGLEKSVEEIVSSITGSKSVKVVITLESGIIYSYADTNEGVSANKTGSGQESTSSESKQSYITVKTADGIGTVSDSNVLTGMLTVRLGEDGATVQKLHRKDVTLLRGCKGRKRPPKKEQPAEPKKEK